jgi:hypothetical protein
MNDDNNNNENASHQQTREERVREMTKPREKDKLR